MSVRNTSILVSTCVLHGSLTTLPSLESRSACSENEVARSMNSFIRYTDGFPLPLKVKDFVPDLD